MVRLLKFVSLYKFHFLLFVFSFLVLSRFHFDTDLGWHLAIGEHFLKTGEVLRRDTFSWTMPGYDWGNSYFVYEVVVAWIFGNFEFLATVVIFGLVGVVAVLIMLPKKLDGARALLVGIGVILAMGNLGVKPHTISFLFFAVLLVLLKRVFLGTLKSYIFWVLFFIAWANLHNGFLIGLGLFLCYVSLGYVLRRKLAVKGIWGFLALVLVLFIGTLLTPFGLRQWQSILNDAFFLRMYFAISEWNSIIVFWPLNAVYGITGIVFVWFIQSRHTKLEPQWVILGALFFLLPFLGAYFAFFWAALFIFLASNFSPNLVLPKSALGIFKVFKNMRQVWVQRLILVVLISAVFVSGLMFYQAASLTSEKRLVLDSFPVSAVDFLKKGNFERVFNNYSWGGYIIWKSEKKVFIDGRMTGWRAGERRILSDYLSILQGKCGLLESWGVETAIIRREEPWKCDYMFDEVYRDEWARVLVRK